MACPRLGPILMIRFSEWNRFIPKSKVWNLPFGLSAQACKDLRPDRLTRNPVPRPFRQGDEP